MKLLCGVKKILFRGLPLFPSRCSVEGLSTMSIYANATILKIKATNAYLKTRRRINGAAMTPPAAVSTYRETITILL